VAPVPPLPLMLMVGNELLEKVAVAPVQETPATLLPMVTVDALLLVSVPTFNARPVTTFCPPRSSVPLVLTVVVPTEAGRTSPTGFGIAALLPRRSVPAVTRVLPA
jgi:hypothetical protein